ncbi:MAG: hypothetical protein LBB10_01720 [Bifidobacteriaceae bacterium]|nr:hypothetical protein [Bifidobacteriaceae bacterium]
MKIADDLCFDAPMQNNASTQLTQKVDMLAQAEPKHLSNQEAIPNIQDFSLQSTIIEQPIPTPQPTIAEQPNFLNAQPLNTQTLNTQNFSNQQLGKTIAIVGANGGIGTTLFSICLSIYLSKTANTILVDGMAGGSGLDIALGLENKTGIRMCDLVNADGKIPAERLFTQAIDYNGLKVLSSTYTNPVFPESSIFANILTQLKSVSPITIIDTPRDRLSDPNFLNALDKIIIVTPNNIQGLSAASAISNLAGEKQKGIIVFKIHSFKNIKLFQDNEIQKYLNVDILGQLKIDSYIKASLESGMPLEVKKNSEISKLCERVSGAF